ncbi:MAG: SoxR reducing system RseC family protein [Chromatiaceae bacterium]|nr:SoxR reducing system RseC family protein [Chromatiaceae bacterium]
MSDMIEAEATVVALEQATVWVETRRRSGCSQCASASQCAPSLLGALLGNGWVRLRLANTLDVRPGEPVIVGLPGGALVRAALLAYLLPLFTLVLGAGLASLWTAREAPVVLAALAGLASGLLLAAQIARWLERHHPERPRLLRRATSATSCSIPATHS